MIKVKVIASGSRGNCTALKCGKATILLDAGIDFRRIQRALNFENPLAALITHEHGDHVNKTTLAELLKRGVNVYMTEGTAQALKLEPRHNLIKLQRDSRGIYDEEVVMEADGLKSGKIDPADVNSWFYSAGILSFANTVKHDAAEPVSFDIVHDGQYLKYLTDSGSAPVNEINQVDILIIEVNHSEADLATANIDDYQKQRILNNHLSIEKASEFIDDCDKDFLEEVHLVHISKRHGNAERFKQIIQSIVGDKVKVYAY